MTGLLIMVFSIFIFFQTTSAANCSDAYLTCLDPKVIKALQRDLKTLGFFNGQITGKYDKATKNSVVNFSKKKNIKYDEYLNKDLVKALWGVDLDYDNATPEERIDFLKKIKVLKETPKKVPGV